MLERRLAAVLAADVVGYSRMMGADEAATLAVFAQLRHGIFEPLVRRHRGEVVKRTGDGWLVEFFSALDAVNCAIAVQESLLKHPAIKLRIGVHIGDVMHDDEGDIHGDGVNIASRLEGVAKPGGVAISDQVYNSLDGTRTPAFGDGGEHDLKNIARPVRVWNWPGVAAAVHGATGAPVDTTPIVLLESLSLGGDVDAAADLALDIQSGLQNALSNRSGIRVATSVEGAGSPTYRLQGRCRVSGARCRLHLSITVAASGETCWTTKIDGRLDDMFGFVDDVVWKTGAAIRVQVNAYAGAAHAAQPDQSLSGQQLLSKAAFFMHHFDTKNMSRARDTMAAAVAREPENPMALAMYSYTLMHSIPLAIENIEDIDVTGVLSLADKAVYFGAGIDYVFHNRARIRLWLRRDHQGCIQDAKRALEINPGFHFAREDLALVDIFANHTRRGVAGLTDIVGRLPAQPGTPYRLSILGIGHAILGDTALAMRRALDAYERKPMVRLHALAYAAAAAKDPTVTGSPGFRAMVEHHRLRVGDAARFPFARNEDTATLALMLRQSGLPA